MMSVDEDALYCDFVEEYRIMDFRSLPASRAAVLAVGMRDDSRIKKKMRGDRLDPKEILLASIFDAIMQLGCAIVGAKEKPASMLDELNGTKSAEVLRDNGVQSFNTPDELNKKLTELRGVH